jgi:hypothetical protein
MADNSLEGVMELEAKSCINVISKTPIDQAIMLVGIHGVGKSEFIKKYFEKQGYAVIMLFLGQMADAGDLIGLPDRSTVTFKYGDEEVTQKITEFCPPKWWPRQDDAKLVIFLDEFNRGKQEVYQCIMDMALNRQLNGLNLPKDTRIIAAINPLDDKYGYQVTELDPALLDRFNVYGFRPSHSEWIDWALSNGVHTNVLGFISKYGANYLDPPADGKPGVVYPSRRSWVRVSDILNKNPELLIEQGFVTLRDICVGIIGQSAASKFYSYIKEQQKGINPGSIVTRWDEKIEQDVKSLNNQELLILNKQLALHLEENEAQYFDIAGLKHREAFAYNVWQYLKTVPREIMADFYDYIAEAYNADNRKEWAEKLLDSNIQGLVDNFIDIVHGKTEEDKKYEDHFKGSDEEKY